MTKSKSLEEPVSRWIEASGRALELRAASIMSQGGWRVSTSFPYVDVTPPNAQREGDVIGDMPWQGFNQAHCLLRLVVECKHTPGKPWVAFYGEGPASSTPSLDDIAIFAHGSHVGIVEPAIGWIGKVPFTEAPASHIATALGNDQQNPANNAVRQALSAAYAIREHYLNTQHSTVSDGPRGWVILACVVTTSPLFTCRLGTGGQIELDPVRRVDVWGHAPDGHRRRVYVLAEEALRDFGQQLGQRVASLEVIR